MPRALILELGGLRLALPAAATSEVVTRTPVAPLPQAAPLLLGLSAVHGRTVPVLNLALLLGVTPTSHDLAVVTSVSGETLALPVDVVHGLMDIPERAPTAELLGPAVQAEQGGRAGDWVRPLNPQALLDRVRTHLARL